MKDLSKAFPETPDMCRQAVLQAVSTYREENETMKKRYMTPVLAAILIVLLCATAYAISSFSLRDTVENPSQAFEESLVPVGNTQSSHGLTITVGDALCDGTDMFASVNVDTEEGMAPVLVMTRIEASRDGQPVDVWGGLSYAESGINRGSVRDFYLLYPTIDEAWPVPEKLLYKSFLSEKATGKIQWTLHFDLYTLNWPLVKNEYDGLDQSEEVFAFYANQQIAHSYGNISTEWWEAVLMHNRKGFVDIEGVVNESGAFTLADTLSFSFETDVQEPIHIQDDTVHQMDGYTVQVQEMTRSALYLEYTLLFRFDESQLPQGENSEFAEMDLMSKVRFVPEGASLENGGKLVPSEDGMTAIYQSKMTYISDEPLPEEITFRWMQLYPEDEPGAVQEFTVKTK